MTAYGVGQRRRFLLDKATCRCEGYFDAPRDNAENFVGELCFVPSTEVNNLAQDCGWPAMSNELDVEPGCLRERAEAKVRERMVHGALGRWSAGELPADWFELEVDKAELELQNEALRVMKRRLREQCAHYRALYELAPAPYLVLDDTGTVREANLAAADLLGVTRNQLVGLPLASFLDQEGTDALHTHLQLAFATYEKTCCALQLHGVGRGTETRVLAELAADQHMGAGVLTCRVVLASLPAAVPVPALAPRDVSMLRAELAASAPTPATRHTPSRVVLLVEHEAAARSALLELLRGEGYTVLSAASPSEAVALSKYAERIDVLLADHRLPGFNGEQLAETLCELHPDLNVILMSGLLAPVQHGQAHFVQKPIDLDELVELIG